MVRRGNNTLVGLSAPRVIIVPRWSGTPDDEWYPWITQELPGTSAVAEPTTSLAAWTDAVARAIGDDPYALARTLVIAHSAGCVAVMHALSKLAPGRAVKHVLFVAGWWTLDSPWPEIQPWLDTPIDLDAVREGQHGMRVLVSTNDPFTADYETNAALWRERLDATVVVIPEARHFTGSVQPIVLDQARTLYAEL